MTTAEAVQNGQATAVPDLQFVELGDAPVTQNILLYGPPGSGKTVGASTAPGPILWLNAEGPNALRFARKHSASEIREVEVTGNGSLSAAFLYVREGSSGINTVVMDTIGEVYRILLEEISNGKQPTLQNYGDVNTKLERFIRALRDLSVNVVLLAHEEIADIEGIPTRRPVTGGKKLPEQVMAQVDIVAYTGVVPATEDAPAKYFGQLVEANGRRAKDRSGALGAAREVNLTEWVEIATGKEGDPA